MDQPRGRLSAIRLLQLNTFVSTLDRFAMPPMLIAIARDMGIPLSQVLQAAGAYFLAYGLMQPVWGMVSDSWGLVRTMRFTLFAAGVCTIASAFVQAAVMLSVGRGLAGGFFAAAYPASLIYLGDTVPAVRRQREVAQLMVGTALGTALASWGAGLLAAVSTWRAAFVVTGVAALVVSVGLGRLPVPERTRTHRNMLVPIVQALRTGAVVLVLLLAFVEGAVLLGVLTLLPPSVEAAGASPAVAGAVTGVYGLAVYISARGVGWLAGRLHPAWLIASGASAALAACALLSFSRSPAVAVPVTLLLGVAWVAMHSSLQTWAIDIVPAARATVVSLFASSLFVGSAVAAVAVAGLAEEQRYALIFTLAALTVIPLGVLATFGRWRWRGTPDDVPGVG